MVGARLDGCNFAGAKLDNAHWDGVSLGQLPMLLGHTGDVTSVCVTADGKRVVSGSVDKTVRVWSLESGEQVRQLSGHTGTVRSVCVTADGKYVVSGSADNTVRVWSLESGEFIRFGEESDLVSATQQAGPFTVSSSGMSVVVATKARSPGVVHQMGGANVLSFRGCTFAGLRAPPQVSRLVEQLCAFDELEVWNDDAVLDLEDSSGDGDL